MIQVVKSIEKKRWEKNGHGSQKMTLRVGGRSGVSICDLRHLLDNLDSCKSDKFYSEGQPYVLEIGLLHSTKALQLLEDPH